MSHRLIVAIVLAALLSLVGVNAVLACNDYSPGYWKNHPEAWPDGIEPTDTFLDTFGLNWFGSELTLMEALRQGGGGDMRTGRYKVADLLNDPPPP